MTRKRASQLKIAEWAMELTEDLYEFENPVDALEVLATAVTLVISIAARDSADASRLLAAVDYRMKRTLKLNYTAFKAAMDKREATLQ